jgi:hypothetical protein
MTTTRTPSAAKSAKARLAVALLAVLAAFATATLALGAGGRADFSVSGSPASRSVTTGQSVDFTVTATRVSGFTGAIDLSVTGLPKDAAAVWPNGQSTSTLGAGASSATLTIRTGDSTPEGTFPLTITGKSGKLTRTATVSVTVTDPPPPTTFAITGGLGAQTLVLDGAALPLGLSLTNPYNQPLQVSNVRAAVASTSNPGCTAENFEVVQVPASVTVSVPPSSTRSLASLGAPDPTVRWVNRPYPQDACVGVTIGFDFSAEGTTAK